MSGSVVVTWDDALTHYDFGPGHPLAPVRVALTMALAAELGVLSEPSVTMVSPSPATDAELETVHDDDYVAAVRRAGRTLEPDPRFGLGTSDDPVFEGMH
ncbi:MAG TPA: acetoin utilization protein AcuC, partial [Trebonia sp.]|nr:acetoin utilization protein AcuC [Trebonia sp.]